jgi:hypothetical protein
VGKRRIKNSKRKDVKIKGGLDMFGGVLSRRDLLMSEE